MSEGVGAGDVGPDEVGGEELRRAMSHLAAGAVLLSCLGDGRASAVTVSSFASLSLDPPLVMVSLRRDGRMHPLLLAAGGWAVSVLAAEQHDLAAEFAVPGGDREAALARLDHRPAPRSGAPVLPEALTWLDCRTEQVVPAGDHSLILGRVLATAGTETDAAPLLHHRRRLRPAPGPS